MALSHMSGPLLVGGVPVSGVSYPLPFMGDADGTGNVWWVDGSNGSNANAGNDATKPLATIAQAISNAAIGDTIYVLPKVMAATDTDPGSYAETLTISKPQLSIIGVSRGRTQGGLPQIKIGAGSTAMLTIRAPGCYIANLGFNGASSTGGGVLLDDDGGSTKSAFGTTIENCHFKNCKVTATDARTGGAIYWATAGNAWQVLIKGCSFYKNVGSIILIGTGGSIPQDVTIEDCVFKGPKASVDTYIYTGGSGMVGLTIRNCDFGDNIPTLSSGSVLRYMDLTGSTGNIVDCTFGLIVSPTGSEGTFAAAGTAAKIPATMFIAKCFGETTTTGETGEIFRT